MPGWSKLEQYAKSTWGDGGWNIVTNPSDYQDSPANACVDASVVQLTTDAPPTCSNQTSIVHGTLDGTKGTVTVDQSSAHSVSGSWSVTKTTTLTDGFTFSLGLSIPEGADASIGFSDTTTVTNEQSKSFSTSTNDTNGISLQIDRPKGKDCSVTLNTQTCNQNTKGSAPIVATGWVWFNYNDARAPLADPKGGTHYKYAASIEGVLTNKADRTSTIEFQGPINMVSRSGYSAKCG